MNNEKITWPGWETVRLIGRGSFGAVYEIERDIFGEKEKAALKVISIPQSEGDIDELYDEGYDDESITDTFKEHLKSIVAEYSLMRKMNGCSNVVNCDDVRFIQHDDGFGWDIFIKMELLTPITKVLGKNVTDEQVIRIGTDLCRALMLCKKHNIIHRDIKPANVFISENGDYKLGDFGIAKTIEKTSGGTKIGTYEYMAPEVYHDEPYGGMADIYSLGMVLYWLLNERRTPFLKMPPAMPTASEKELARRRRFEGERIPAPAHGGGELKRIVLKAVAYDPKDRYACAEDMLRELESINGASEVSPPPRPLEAVKAYGQERAIPPQPAAVPAYDDEPAADPGRRAEAPVPAAAVRKKTEHADAEIDEDGTVCVWETRKGAPAAIDTKTPAAVDTEADGTVGIFQKKRNDSPAPAVPSLTETAEDARHKNTEEKPAEPKRTENLKDTAFKNPEVSFAVTKGTKSVGEYTFNGVPSLLHIKTVGIPVSVEKILPYAFENFKKLKDIYYAGDEEQWKKIDIAVGNGKINAAQIHFGAKIPKSGPKAETSSGGFWGATTPTPPITQQVKTQNEFAYTITDGSKTIGEYSFVGCPSLLQIKTVFIPESVTRIQAYTFAALVNLTDVRYAGSEEQWKSIKVETGNGRLLKASIHFCSKA